MAEDFERVTARDVKEAIFSLVNSGLESQAVFVMVGKCSMCGYETRYVYNPSGGLYFDAGCWCRAGQRLEPRTFQDLADLINMQRDPERRAEIMKRCGFKVDLQNA